MTNPTNPTTAPLDDASERFSLIEMDAPTRQAPAVRQPIPVVPAPVTAPVAPHTSCGCAAQSRPLAVRGVCPACNLPRIAARAVSGQAVQPQAVPAAPTWNPLGIESLRPAPAPAPIAEMHAPAGVLAANRAQLTGRELVAGAAAEGHGILTSFDGLGQMTRALLIQTIGESGLSIEPPAAKSAHAHAGHVLGALNHLGYVCRADSKRRSSKSTKNAEEHALAMLVAHDAKLEGKHGTADRIVNDQTNGIPTWAARWTVAIGAGRAAEVGAAFGHVVMVATLDQAGELWIETTDTALEARVRAEFQARIAGEIYQAADVSAFLTRTLVNTFRAAKLGGSWYVRRRYAADAERLLTAFSRRWGRNWMLPALPIATSDQLRVGLVNGLVAEANEVLDEYRAAIAEAAKKGEDRISGRSASTLHARLVTLAERAVGFGAIVGEEYTAKLRASLTGAAEEIAESIDGISQRFGLIFDELARDAKRSES